MEDSEKKPRKSRWVALVITTIISICVTIGVAWYQISKSELQAARAEKEREKNIRNTLVSIVEEHVINEKPIDITRLARLIDSRRREEGLKASITVLEVFEKAEFNILNSRYLDFDRKQKYKAVFDEVYKEYGSRTFKPFPEGPYSDLVNELARTIQEGKTSEALEQIRRIAEAYQKDIQEMKIKIKRRPEIDNIFYRLFEKPEYLVMFILLNVILIIVLFIIFPPYRRILRKMIMKLEE